VISSGTDENGDRPATLTPLLLPQAEVEAAVHGNMFWLCIEALLAHVAICYLIVPVKGPVMSLTLWLHWQLHEGIRQALNALEMLLQYTHSCLQTPVRFKHTYMHSIKFCNHSLMC